MYVTSYFRKIDARRKTRGSLTLLPLKKIERPKFVDPYNLRPSKLERVHLTSQTVKLLLEMISVTTFILLDRLFFEALDLVKRHAHMEYVQVRNSQLSDIFRVLANFGIYSVQAGHHDLTLEVRGIGVIATLIRSVVRGFNVKRRVKTVVSNSACLPRASRISNRVIFKIYSTYLGIWLLLFTAAYTQRLRRIICSFFYRKREKRRILYLYNESLRRRLGYAR